jgi:DNA-binding NarL/FixJ family response regulator
MTRILLIDDSDALRRSVRAVLDQSLPDLTVGEAAGALSGLALVESQPWDAVLLDLSLPDRGGLETLRDIRRLRPELPVLVMSLHAEAEYGVAARAAGATGYLAKGSVADTVASAVRGVLRAPEVAPPLSPSPLSPSAADLDREEERRRLADLLHDDIGQALVAAKIDLHLAVTAPDPAEARRRTSQAMELVDRAIVAIRELTAQLRPPLLEELGLVAAARALLARVGNGGPPAVSLDVDAALPRAGAGEEMAALRAVEELVARHRQSGRAPAVLSLRAAGGALTIALRDGARTNAELVLPYHARAIEGAP